MDSLEIVGINVNEKILFIDNIDIRVDVLVFLILVYFLFRFLCNN